MSGYKHIQRRIIPDGEVSLLEENPLLSRIYRARGILSSQELDNGLKGLHPFSELLGMPQAVQRLTDALQKQERLLIIGDYDADGATATALAVSALKAFGFQSVNFLVPNRFSDGYGLTPEIVAVAATYHPHVLMTVDNGISSIVAVEAARVQGIDVIVTDHHLAGEELPKACAIVNPNQPGDPFPSKAIAGVGVVFYVMLALRAHLRSIGWFTPEKPEPNMAQFLDLVALGTVADVVKLDHNNRILVHQGVMRIRQGLARPGILALLEVAGRDWRHVQSSDLGFIVGPRLNAAGRLEDMTVGITGLLSETPEEAHEIARQLHNLNYERQSLEQDMKAQALEMVDSLKGKKHLPYGLCLFQEDWHPGIIGLVAARVKEAYHRPTIAFARDGEEQLKGSARSIPGVHIRDLLQGITVKQPGLIIKFGGHAMAAGLSIYRKDYGTFSGLLEKCLQEWIEPSILQAILWSDGPLGEAELCLHSAHQVREGGPWGQGFPEPLFEGEFELVDQRIVGQKHLKMVLKLPGSPRLLDAIAFSVSPDEWPKHRCQKVFLVYRLEVNRYQGKERMQLCAEYVEAIA